MSMDEFVTTYLSMVEKPIIINGKIGFMLSSGIRMYFSNTHLSKHNSKRLSDHYKKKGITNVL